MRADEILDLALRHCEQSVGELVPFTAHTFLVVQIISQCVECKRRGGLSGLIERASQPSDTAL